tara:strand:- start:957 stop:1421 length:465 start_codon:yes stop_codon:yes gene_type:complete
LELPEDYGSIHSKQLDDSNFQPADLALSCAQINEDKNALRDQRTAIRNNIVTSRDGDQIVGFIASVAFPPLWLAVDNQSDKKSQIKFVEMRLDSLNQLVRFKSCFEASDFTSSISEFERDLSELTDLKSQNVITEEEYTKLRRAVFERYYPDGF